MSFTLFDCHVNAHDYVGTIFYDNVSDSTDTVSIESTYESSGHADDQFNSGTIYFLESVGTTSVEGQFRRITDYDASSGKYTWTTALASTVSSGGTFGVATPEFNMSLMDRLTNAALRTLGPFVYTARAVATSVNQKVYQISTAVATDGSGTFGKFSKPFLVEIQGRTGSSVDNPDWVELHGWKPVPTTAGAGGGIEFPRFLPANRDVRVWYEDHHINLTASTQIIDERIHPELVTLALVEKMYQYRNSRSRGATEFDIQRWTDAKQQLAEARVRWPVWRPSRQPDINVFGGGIAREQSQAPPFGSLE